VNLFFYPGILSVGIGDTFASLAGKNLKDFTVQALMIIKKND
jgi:hypothetical protein